MPARLAESRKALKSDYIVTALRRLKRLQTGLWLCFAFGCHAMELATQNEWHQRHPDHTIQRNGGESAEEMLNASHHKSLFKNQQGIIGLGFLTLRTVTT